MRLFFNGPPPGPILKEVEEEEEGEEEEEEVIEDMAVEIVDDVDAVFELDWTWLKWGGAPWGGGGRLGGDRHWVGGRGGRFASESWL